ncbi:MAG: glycine--tRNA ligase subunit beta, partial [Spirochaetia bacterium]|nr:glycine--tRNA ligase subunit beta [Spirochaetia bacterium]
KKNGVRLLETEKVIPIVRDLTEWPHLVIASFDESFLRLPREVLISEMVEHQKYFPVEDTSGKLKAQFVITANIEKEEHVIRGNLKVLTSRLRDGAFLYEEDLKTSLSAMGEKLRTVTYMKELGTISEKIERTVIHAKALADSLKLSSSAEADKLCGLMKNDLVSKMVYEFPALQGVIGEYYAAHQAKVLGIDPKLAVAIREHYMPLGAGAALPETPAGIVLSLAEKIETLLGHFAIGNIPTGSQDPFALRRQALGVIRILVEKKLTFSLFTHLLATAKTYQKIVETFKSFPDEEKFRFAVIDFVQGRFKGYLKDLGYAPDEIETLPDPREANDFHDLVARLEV